MPGQKCASWGGVSLAAESRHVLSHQAIAQKSNRRTLHSHVHPSAPLTVVRCAGSFTRALSALTMAASCASLWLLFISFLLTEVRTVSGVRLPGSVNFGLRSVGCDQISETDHGLADHCSLAALEEKAASLISDASTGPLYYDATPVTWAVAHNYRLAKIAQHSAASHKDLHDAVIKAAFESNCYNGGKGVYLADAEEKIRASNGIKCSAELLPHCPSGYGYRTADGTCNNLKHPTYGMVGSTLLRLSPSTYEDGVGQPRTRSVTGKQLRSPREISLIVNDRISHINHQTTHLFMQFGQFVDHDMMSTPGADDFLAIDCCAENFKNSTSAQQLLALQETLDDNPSCFKIPVPVWDPVYNTSNCMNFVRSVATQPDKCIVGPRQQYNVQTPFVDLSLVYGPTVERQAQLRSFSNGRLRSQHVPGSKYDLLPIAPPGTPEANRCNNESLTPGQGCFYAGDARINGQSLLISIHTLFMLEHNRVADVLGTINPHWDDEKLFQEARKVVIAEMQHITFGTYIPIVIGSAMMNEYDLWTYKDGHFYDYDERINPSLNNEFVTAAFRFGHSLVRNDYSRLGKHGQNFGRACFRNHFFSPEENYDVAKGGAGGLMRGMLKDHAERFDRLFSTAVADYLYSTPTVLGFDLVALSVQRGRDHAIQPYTHYRAAVGLSIPRSFDDLADTHSAESIRKLAAAYDHIDDIDVYEGAFSEESLHGAIVGPMFARMIAFQMKMLKYGDRFYYETADKEVGFNTDQLNEIRKVTMAGIICQNYGVANGIQVNAFLSPSYDNPLVSCDQLSYIDFNLWKDH